MGDQIQQIAHKLDGINAILSNNSNPLSLEQAMLLYHFFNDFQDTNTLIETAEGMAHKDLNNLEDKINTLSECVDRFLTLKGTNVLAIDYKEICKQLMQPYEESYENAKGISTQLWQDYQSISNRLDYLPLESEEYKEVDLQCDAAKSAYDKARADTEQLYDEYNAKRRDYAGLYFFKAEYMYVLIEKIKDITESIMSDIRNLRKEGNL